MDHVIPVEGARTDDAAPATIYALWNPRAAACWALLLSPAFGAYLHMRNWEQLGEHKRAKEARTWFYMVCTYMALGMLVVGVGTAYGRDWSPPSSVAIALTLVWYLHSGRAQERHVRELTGDRYTRQGWAVPILCAVGIFFGVVMLSTMLSLVLAPAVG
jgi:hypothetical protein